MARVRAPGTPQALGTGDSPTFAGLTVTGNVTIVGSIATEEVYATLNNDRTSGAPSEDMGFRARRGASAWWIVGWDETLDRTVIGTSSDGTVANVTLGRLDVSRLLVGDGSTSAPSIALTSQTNSGFVSHSGYLGIVAAGLEIIAFHSSALSILDSVPLQWASGVFSSVTTQLGPMAAASLRQGLAPNATPVAQIFTLGEASRPGTDSNVAGASGTFRSGLGTGTGTVSTLIFQTPTVAASGSGTQTYTTRATITAAGIVVGGITVGDAVAHPIGNGVWLIHNASNGGIGNCASGHGAAALAFFGGGNVGAFIGSWLLTNGSVYGWSSSPTAAGNNTGIERVSDGVVGVNNGSAGTYRDLRLRNLLDTNGVQVVSTQGAAVADATTAVDVITRFNEWMARARAHGLVAT